MAFNLYKIENLPAIAGIDVEGNSGEECYQRSARAYTAMAEASRHFAHMLKGVNETQKQVQLTDLSNNAADLVDSKSISIREHFPHDLPVLQPQSKRCLVKIHH